MKINLINQSKQSIGGGWTFLRNFKKYLQKAGIEVTESLTDADVIFISGATMVDRQTIEACKANGKRIVLRVDNVPRNSRNRNTGTSRLYDFAQLADLVVYQSEWAKSYLMPFLKKDGPVIINGADEDIFKVEGDARPRDGQPQYLFCQFNRDETKQFHQAWYQFIMDFRNNPEAHLWLVGNFSPELIQYGFDFFMGEKFSYLGVIEDPAEMAEIYRGATHLYLPYFNDACSNTLIEYGLCNPDGQGNVFENQSGGNPDIFAASYEELTASGMTARYLAEIKKIL